MKKILGLDLGTNSIGWALIEHDFKAKEGRIIDTGVRVIPMDQGTIEKFGTGQTESQTAERTRLRGMRRLYERKKLRRDRLHRVMNILGWLPDHYKEQIDFNKNLGQFKKEVKLNYRENDQGKYEFIFQDSFGEMIRLFEEKCKIDKVPKDWTIYYLRKKALNEKISKQELAWIVLNFNQKRGYYELRGDEKEDDNVSYEVLEVAEVKKLEKQIKGKDLYSIHFSDGREYTKTTTKPENWLGHSKEFIITEKTLKSGEVKFSYKEVDSEKDWIAIKKSTEKKLDQSGKHVGEFIFDELLKNNSKKIIGGLITTIDRDRYKDELHAILKKQAQFHEEFKDQEVLTKLIFELYSKNFNHQQKLQSKDLTHLLVEDIIFYQRPLKSKKSTVSNCPFEHKWYYENDNIKTKAPIKCIPKSNPYFQEFRIWQFLRNLKIYEIEKEVGGKLEINYPITDSVFGKIEYEELFELLNTKKTIQQKDIINYLVDNNKISKSKKKNFRWNYPEDKVYPGNKTRHLIANGIKSIDGIITEDVLTNKFVHELWHIIYSVRDKIQFEKALYTFASKNFDKKHHNQFVSAFINTSPFDSEYGSYSEKAIKRFLPLLRIGKFWKPENIDKTTKKKIDKIIDGEYDEDIPNELREKLRNIENVRDCQFLPVWLSSLIIYNRFSELETSTQWKSPESINLFLKEFKQHSLRNPIVEQVVTETLRLVRDIWIKYGEGKENYFKEIHLELGRDLKNSKKVKERISAIQTKHENTNIRIRELLKEIAVETNNVRDYSPSHQEILKLYEEGVRMNPSSVYDQIDEKDIDKIQKSNNPSQKDIQTYKMWLEQGYISPYTGQTIGLSELFSEDYENEHIIPRSRVFDDSLSNKVISETAVNRLKGKMTAYEFMSLHGGEIIDLGNGRSAQLLTLDQFEDHCNKYYSTNKLKLKKLLSEEPPSGFIERQINDTRYISKYVKNLLSNIVREKGEKAVTSKNLLSIPGKLTSKLRYNWGLSDKWNKLIEPRFKRLNTILNTTDFGYFDPKINAFRIQVPDEIREGFNPKRIDHRHHALDALIVAATTRNHIQYISNLNQDKIKYELQPSVMIKNEFGDFTRNFQLPWSSFPVDSHKSLEEIIVSIKQNLRVINRTNNNFISYKDNDGNLRLTKDGKPKKGIRRQKGKNFAIRKSLHKATVSGMINIKRIKSKKESIAKYISNWELIVDYNTRMAAKDIYLKCDENTKEIKKFLKNNPFTINGEIIDKIDVYEWVHATASRVSLEEITTRKHLESITDSGIKGILERHLTNYKNMKGEEDFSEAFSPGGIARMNENIVELNNGKFHHPIKKVRKYEVSSKFPIGEIGNKSDKYVEADKGTNLFFAIYWDEEKQKRIFDTVPLHEVIAHQKQVKHMPYKEQLPIQPKPELGEFLFTLSPNDLVYIPNEEEIDRIDNYNISLDKKRIYKMVSCTKGQCFFIHSDVSSSIVNKVEFSSLNKMERSIDNLMIKNVCWKLKLNRTGQVIYIDKGIFK